MVVGICSRYHRQTEQDFSALGLSRQTQDLETKYRNLKLAIGNDSISVGC